MNKQALIAAVLSLLSITGLAQTPTFRTETTVVQLPVRVLDTKGKFVKDLGFADIEVLEDGVPQTISEFALVDLSSRAKAPSPLTVPSSGVLSAADLEHVPGRLYLFLLDDAHVGVGHSARARNLIKGFIRDRMTPADAAAVVIASGAARQDFTSDKAALLRAVDRFTGTLDSGEPARVQEVRARGIVKLVTDLAGALASIRGRHKTLVYVASQVGCRVAFEATTDFEPRLKGERLNSGSSSDANLSSAGSGAAADSDEQILCNEELRDAVRAAVQANVSLYSVDPRGLLNRGWVSPAVDGRGGPGPARGRMLAVEPAKPSLLDGFYVLSDQTGGFAVADTNNYRASFDRIVRESSTYYLLAYTSTNNKIDGKYRRTQINVKRPGLEAFYRAGYMAPRP